MALLLSLFCCAGGLDLGFEQAGFKIGLAFDKDETRVASYNHNRLRPAVAHSADVRALSLQQLDNFYGEHFAPDGVIGGPPCQSFSQANRSGISEDPRHRLPIAYSQLIAKLNRRSPVKFFVLENVPGLTSPEHKLRFAGIKRSFTRSGFNLFTTILNAGNYNTPQNRKRLFLVGLNRDLFPDRCWYPPAPTIDKKFASVRDAIGGLPEPFIFDRAKKPPFLPHHPNHWCMRPKSAKFSSAGALIPGNGNNRSFKTLHWDRPSLTVAYGHREVHIHPGCHRRLSVFEAMRLQGFPDSYELLGNLSEQYSQISEAVPPRLAHAIAQSVGAVVMAED